MLRVFHFHFLIYGNKNTDEPFFQLVTTFFMFLLICDYYGDKSLLKCVFKTLFYKMDIYKCPKPKNAMDFFIKKTWCFTT